VQGALRRGACAACAVGVSLALAGPVQGALIVGVNDSAPLDPSDLAWFYPTEAAEGLQLDTLTLRWDDTAPSTIPNRAEVGQAIAEAKTNGISIELDLYPLHSMAFTGGAECAPSTDPQACGNTAEIDAFAAWTTEVANAFPSVHEFVLMNECNQPLFINPQWNSAGQNQSAEICGRALVASYDGLKAVSSQNFVWGVGLSPRGNDDPKATSDSSTSPVMFLQDLGAWFKSYVAATGRTTPLMDGLDFHPYPIPQSLPFATGYAAVDEATVSNLPRIYQAFYNGFNGSAQPTIGQQAGGGLPMSLSEVGIQTAETGVPGYVGTEVSGNAAGGVYSQYATQAYQASWYVEMLNLVACDPNVRLVNSYHLIDEADLTGWQSGLYEIERDAKQSAAAVHDWIASTGGKCQGTLKPWTPSGVSTVATAPPPVAKESAQRILVASDGRIRIFDAVTYTLRRVIAPFGDSYTGPLSVALGERSGVSVVAVGEGSGGRALVKLFNGTTWQQLASLEPFAASFKGGVTVAFGKLNGKDDLIVGSGPGMAAQVKVYNQPGDRLIEQVTPFGASFRGGVSVAAGDLNGKGPDDLIVATGPWVRTQVNVYTRATSAILESLTPFGTSFEGGATVAAGDLTGDGTDDLIVGSGAGRASVVTAYRGATKTRLWSVDAFAPTFTGGVGVAAFSLTGSAGANLVLGAGAGGGAQVKILNGKTAALLATFLGNTGSDAIDISAG
jgi:hypothetical protein